MERSKKVIQKLLQNYNLAHYNVYAIGDEVLLAFKWDDEGLCSDDTRDSKMVKKIKEETIEMLKKEGFNPKWNGKAANTIRVHRAYKYPWLKEY